MGQELAGKVAGTCKLEGCACKAAAAPQLTVEGQGQVDQQVAAVVVAVMEMAQGSQKTAGMREMKRFYQYKR